MSTWFATRSVIFSFTPCKMRLGRLVVAMVFVGGVRRLAGNRGVRFIGKATIRRVRVFGRHDRHTDVLNRCIRVDFANGENDLVKSHGGSHDQVVFTQSGAHQFVKRHVGIVGNLQIVELFEFARLDRASKRELQGCRQFRGFLLSTLGEYTIDHGADRGTQYDDKVIACFNPRTALRRNDLVASNDQGDDNSAGQSKLLHHATCRKATRVEQSNRQCLRPHFATS